MEFFSKIISKIKSKNFKTRIKMRLDSYIFEIPNFLNIFEKNISKRIYRGKDPFNDLTLFSPTYRQLKIMQNELYINNNFYKSIDGYNALRYKIPSYYAQTLRGLNHV